MRTSTKATLLLMIVGVCTATMAQTLIADTPQALAKIDLATLDFSVPESPAFAVLGVTPQTVSRPSSPRSLATSLLNGVDQNGNFQTGFALDTAPYLLFQGNKLTLFEYQQKRWSWKRFLARTTLSIATAKGTNDADKSTRIGTGLRFTIFDEGDPRLDESLTQTIENAIEQAMATVPPLSPTQALNANAVAQHEKDIQDAIKKATNASTMNAARKTTLKSKWNKSSMIVGFAPSWISKTGSSSDLTYNGGAVWSSVALRLGSHAQTILYGKYQNKENVPDPNVKGQFFLQNSTFAGGQFRAGTENTVGSFEAVYLHTSPQGKRTDNFFRFSVGAERKIADNLWLHVGIGGESGRQNGQNKMFVLSSFKWGFGSK
jgi:hypothetical protein